MLLGLLLGITFGLSSIYWEKKWSKFKCSPGDIFIFGAIIAFGSKMFYVWYHTHQGWGGLGIACIAAGLTRYCLIISNLLYQQGINENIPRYLKKNYKNFLIYQLGIFFISIFASTQWLNKNVFLSELSSLIGVSVFLTSIGLYFLHKWLISSNVYNFWIGGTLSIFGIANIFSICFFVHPAWTSIGKNNISNYPLLLIPFLIISPIYVLGMFAAGMYLLKNFLKRNNFEFTLSFALAWSGSALILSILGIILLFEHYEAKNLLCLFGGLSILPFGMGILIISISLCLMSNAGINKLNNKGDLF